MSACDPPGVMRIVGLTGGIASGKSTVARALVKLGARVIDADAIVHELQAPGGPLLDPIRQTFGPGVLDSTGALDREALGAIVFRDADARERLEKIVHPQVGAEMRRRIGAARDAGVGLIVLDIPLLFEGRAREGEGAAQIPFDATILVTVSEKIQIARQMHRDGCDRDEALRRIRAQMPLEEKTHRADFVIDNSGTLEETEVQVGEVFDAIHAAPE